MNYFTNLTSAIPESVVAKLNAGSISGKVATMLNDLKNKFFNSLSVCSALVDCSSDLILNAPDLLLNGVVDVTQPVVESFPDLSGVINDFDEIANKFGMIETILGHVDAKTIVVTTAEGYVVKFVELDDEIFTFDGEALTPFITKNLDDEYDVNYVLHCLKTETSDDFGVYPKYLFTDLVANLSENSAISEVLHDAVAILLMGKSTAESKLSNLLNSINTTWESAVSVAKSVVRGWTTGGIYGVIMVIINIIRGPASMEVDDDGTLKFTDISSLAPQVYITGLVQVVTNIVTMAASAIAAIWAPAVALAVSAIGGLVGQIFGIVNTERSKEYPYMIEDTNCVGDLAPFPGTRAKVQLTAAQVASLKEHVPFLQENGMMMACVPGGLIIGILNSVGVWSYEFHPDITNRISWISNFNLSDFSNPGAAVGENSWSTLILPRGGLTSSLFLQAYADQKAPVGTTTTGDLPAYEDWSVVPWLTFDYVNDEVSGHLTNIQGKRLAFYTMVNLFIFYVWLNSPVRYMPLPYPGELPYARKVSFKYVKNLGSNGYAFPYDGTDDLKTIVEYYFEYLEENEESPTGYSWVPSASVLNPHQYDYLFVISLLSSIGSLAEILRRGNDADEPPSSFFASYCTDPWLYLNKFVSKLHEYLTTSIMDDESDRYLSLVQPSDYSYTSYIIRMNAASLFSSVIPTDNFAPIAGSVTWTYKQPEYTYGSVLSTMIALAIATTVVAIAATAVTVAAKISINKKRTLLAAKTNSAWDKFYQNPTDENLKDYRKICRKNNLFTKVFGGTQYSTAGLWADASTTDATGRTKEIISTLGSKMNEMGEDRSMASAATYSTVDVIKLIRGSTLSEE